MRPTFEAIRERCRVGVFDLRWLESPAPKRLGLRGEFEDNGDYFTIWANGVSYLELANYVSIWGGIDLLSLADLSTRVPKYAHVRERYDAGSALVLWGTQSSLEAAPADEIFVIVADELTFELGPDF